jgi:hypothetical protein
MSSNSTGDSPDDRRRRLKAAFKQITIGGQPDPERRVELPPGLGSLPQTVGQGETLHVDGTNVIRVPFGVRQSRRPRPERPERWATVVLPFQQGGPLPPPPQAA